MFKALLAALALSVFRIGAAQAATMVYATSAKIIQEGPRGTSNNRANINNALGAPDLTFFELGYRATVDFYFGTSFTASGMIVEVTNVPNPANWLEGVIVQVGTTVNRVFTLGGTASPDPLLNTANGTFTFTGGPFNTVRLIDVTCTIPGGKCDDPTGGFDVNSIGVMAVVPLPAAGLLLLSAVGDIAALRRRKAVVA